MIKIKKLTIEHRKKLSDAKVTHGLSRTSFYRRFIGAKNRCNNVKSKDYPQYGGRGIKFLWKSFEDFRDDMYKTYSQNLTLDRVNVNGHYCKENCRWATRKEQSRNLTNNNLIKYDDKIKSLSEWAEFLNKPRYVIENRLNRGWSIYRAFNAEIRNYGN